ncbi:galectin-9 isoform X1 [Pelobates cultripes]|uniref:Galectin n=1 Tax=Pelobates cultripes TaxID=61616 RepID=A0AAD1VNB0_PELCU|nr:galectin-9 isoform X1 [Pelobates cultripes]
MSHGPIYNPPVPFTTPFPYGLNDGTLVVISGNVTHSGDRFAVNLQCGHGGKDDIAFHFNPRFEGGIVVCNTMEHQNWGSEENKREMPFHRGQPFEIRILVSHHSYMVSVNRNHFVEYKHRIPIHRVNTLNINGSVALTSVDIQAQGAGFLSQMNNPAFAPQPGFAPQQFPGGPAFNPGQFPGAPMQFANFAIPYTTNIFGGFFPSKTIVINGTVSVHPKRFHINLKFKDGTALHFNPRFDENTIVRNSRLNNSWGKEERQLSGHGMCFAPGQSFVIQIICEPHAFKVNVNGHHVCDFNHRVHNLQQIDTLEIDGDVTLQHVQI